MILPVIERKKRRRVGLIVSLLINLAIVVFIAVRELRNNAEGIQRVSVHDINLLYLLPGIACFFAAAWAETTKYRRLLVKAEGKDDPLGALECALYGRYYDNITPFGAGGQPFQISYLKRRGYSAGTSGAVPIASFLTQQFAFILIAVFVFLTNRDISDSILLIRITAYVGLCVYSLPPVGLLLFAIFPKPCLAILRWAVRCGAKLRLIKDREQAERKATAALNDYTKCMRLFYTKPATFIRLILISFVYHTAVLSIPFFMLHAFGGSGSWWMTFSLVVYIHCAITIIPTPGNSGAAEGSFYAVFSSLEEGMLFWAMIFWRILVYYSWLFCGILLMAFGSFLHRREIKKTPKPDGPLRIAQFVGVFPSGDDGASRAADAYARNLQARGHDVFVVAPEGADAAEDSAAPYPVCRVRSFRVPLLDAVLPRFGSAHGLRRIFADDPPDVIHVHSPFGVSRLALRLGKKYRIPVYATFHGKFDACGAPRGKLSAWLMERYAVSFYTKADHVWASSSAAALTLQRLGYNGTICIMEDDADLTEALQKSDSPCRTAISRLDLSSDRPLLLFVGRLNWQKNLRLILDTMKLLSTGETPCMLVCAGDGDHSEAIRTYCHELGLDDCVRFIGQVDDLAARHDLYAAADLLFFPSVYDNAPQVVREAALAGLPSLLTAGSNAAEIVKNGVNGYTAEASAEAMAARILEILSDTEALMSVGRNAKETIPAGWDQLIWRVTAAYRTGSKEGHVEAVGKAIGQL